MTDRPRGRVWAKVPAAGIGIALGLAVVARFVAPSALWLDEAQSVAIARLPLPGLIEALRQDGSPPLYYLLLHAWMGLVGTGSLAVRSLSGLFSVLTLLLAWRLTCQLAGRRAALALVMLLATSPFVIRYASEARMYSLLLLLTVVGAMAVRTVLRSPGPWPVLGLAAVTGALLLTHLWSFHLVAVVGVLALLELRNRRDAAVRVLTGLGLGVLTFLPWLPSFLVQLSHTGTPWTGQQGLWALPVALDAWQGGPGPMPRVLGTALILLVGLGVLAVPSGLRRPGHLLLGLRLRRSRAQLLVLSLGTLVVAAVVSLVTHSGLAGRYASIALPPFLALAALGVAALPTARARAITLTVVAGLGLTVALPTLMIPRTQAGEVARALRVAAPGDLVVFCPDQLGPSVSRLAPRGLRLVVYPDLRPAGRVDWTDYSDRVTAVPSTTVASTVLQRAGEHAIWVVTGRGYRLPSDARCRDFVRELTDVRGAPSQVVAYRSGVFEGQSLQRFAQHPLSALGRTSPPVDGAQSAGGGGTGVTTAYG